MLAITPFTTASKILGVLHIASVVAAFGPLLVYPTLRRAGAAGALARLHMRVVMPAMLVMWVFGMGLAGVSKPEGADDPVYHLSETWLALAVVDWVVLMAVGWFLIRPALRDTGEAATARLSAGIGVTHLGLAIGLVLMVWKPGA